VGHWPGAAENWECLGRVAPSERPGLVQVLEELALFALVS